MGLRERRKVVGGGGELPRVEDRRSTPKLRKVTGTHPCLPMSLPTSRSCPLSPILPDSPLSPLLTLPHPPPHQPLLCYLFTSTFPSPASSPFAIETCLSSPRTVPGNQTSISGQLLPLKERQSRRQEPQAYGGLRLQRGS